MKDIRRGGEIVKKKIQKWILAFMAVWVMLVSILVQTFIYIIKGQFDFSALLGTFTGAAILIIINVAIVHLIKDKAHENR